jgi:hypothetical protein
MKKTIKNKSRKNVTRKVLGKIAKKNKKRMLKTLKQIKLSLKKRKTNKSRRKKIKGGKSIPFAEISSLTSVVTHNVSEMGNVFKDIPLEPPNSLSTSNLSPSVSVTNIASQMP